MNREPPSTLFVVLVAVVLAGLQIGIALLVWGFWPLVPLVPLDLAELPNVESIEETDSRRPRRVVIHLLDDHTVSRALFAEDIRREAGRAVPDCEVDCLYAEHLDKAEAVQDQLEAILRKLAYEVDSLPVYLEGLTERDVAAFRMKSESLYAALTNKIATTRLALTEGGLQEEEARELEREYAQWRVSHRVETLHLGASFNLCAKGRVDVRALEDEQALEAAAPRWKGGKLQPDPEVMELREEAMARRLAAAKDRLVVVILEGSHDLGDRLKKHAPRVRYIRVTTRAYREARMQCPMPR
jgi:hypothetical protein